VFEALFACFHPGHVNVPPGFHLTWAGSLIRDEFDGICHAGQSPLEPSRDEEWFEWHTLLTAVSEALGVFRMAKLGAGYGRWAVAGGIAARRIGLQSDLICVEAEPTHAVMLRQHLPDNDLAGTVIEAAVCARDGEAEFTVGRPAEWWGQYLVALGPAVERGTEVSRVRTVSLATVLESRHNLDLLDMDIQGAEADVIESSLPLLRQKVRRLHIGTHSPEVEARIRVAMRSIDFRPVWDFPPARTVETPIGRLAFEDGVQVWVRP
jgi:FkbM family methyltransferase